MDTLEEIFEDENPMGAMDSPVFILALDPGVTTGYAAIMFDEANGVPLPQSEEVRVFQGQISYGGSGNARDLVSSEGGFVEQRICNDIADLFQAGSHQAGKSALVIEDFIIRKQNSTRDFLAPVRITSGVLQEVYDISPNVIFQSPADAKSVCTDERMDRWGFTIRTQKDRHSRDALRHSVLFLRKLLEDPRKLSALA